MSILGIGGPELILLLVLAILILGPERAPQAARAIGKQWRAITSAEWWQSAVQMWHFVRRLPQNMAELAEVKEIQASLSDELTQMRSLTQSVQEEVESVSKPVEAALKGNALQSALQEMGDELKQSLSQAEAPVSTGTGAEETPPAPAVAPQPSVPITPPGPAATPPPAIQSSVPAPSLGLGQDVDEQMIALAEQISEQIDQLPGALTRLDELENQQTQLASRLERLQQSLDALLGDLGNQATEDEALPETPNMAE